MPRGSKPGERRGGRQRGTPNKKTALRNAALAAAAANPDISPRDFLLAAMRDPSTPGDRRVKIALLLVRQANENPPSAHRQGPTQSGELIDGASSLLDGIVANALREDYHHLTELQKSVDPGRRDKLSSAEIEEESTLRARIADRASEIGCPKGYGPTHRKGQGSRTGAGGPEQLLGEFPQGGLFRGAEVTKECPYGSPLSNKTQAGFCFSP
jgi:hypothetical protein